MTTTRIIGNTLNSLLVSPSKFKGQILSLPYPLDAHSVHFSATKKEIFDQLESLLEVAIQELISTNFISVPNMNFEALDPQLYSIQLKDDAMTVGLELHDNEKNPIRACMEKLIEEMEIESIEIERILLREHNTLPVQEIDFSDEFLTDEESLPVSRQLNFSSNESSEEESLSVSDQLNFSSDESSEEESLPRARRLDFSDETVASFEAANNLYNSSYKHSTFSFFAPEEKTSNENSSSSEDELNLSNSTSEPSSDTESRLSRMSLNSSDDDSIRSESKPRKRMRFLNSELAKAFENDSSDDEEIELRHKTRSFNIA